MSGGPRSVGPFVIEGPIHRDDIPALCTRVTRFIADIADVAGDVEIVVCELAPTVTPSDVTVEALARLQLTALRLGHRLQLGPCGPTLRALLDQIGFSEVIPDASTIVGALERQVEAWEAAVDVEEDVTPGDPPP